MAPYVGSLNFCSGEFCYSIGAVNILFGILTVPENLLVLIALWRIARRKTWTTPNILIASIALTDFGTGLICQPLHGYFIIRQRNVYNATELSTADTWLFFTLNYFSYSLCGASLLIVALMSLDRFMAIAKSLQYRDRSSRKRTVVSIIAIFIISFGVPTIRFASESMVTLFMGLIVLLVVVALVITVAAYAALLYMYRKHSVSAQLVRENSKFSPSQDVYFARQQRRLTNSFAILAGILLFMYLPQLVFKPASLMTNMTSNSPNTLVLLEDIFNTVLYCNSFVNPIVYCFRHNDIRRHIQAILCCQDNAIQRRPTRTTTLRSTMEPKRGVSVSLSGVSSRDIVMTNQSPTQDDAVFRFNKHEDTGTNIARDCSRTVVVNENTSKE